MIASKLGEIAGSRTCAALGSTREARDLNRVPLDHGLALGAAIQNIKVLSRLGWTWRHDRPPGKGRPIVTMVDGRPWQAGADGALLKYDAIVLAFRAFRLLCCHRIRKAWACSYGGFVSPCCGRDGSRRFPSA